MSQSDKRELLFAEGSMEIWREPSISPEVTSFLQGIDLGSAGARYEHKDTATHVQHLQNPVLLCIREEGQILATAVFCQGEVLVNGQARKSTYIRYFAADPAIRGRGIIKRLGPEVMRLIREGETEPTIYFASVERGNKASYRVVTKAGYRPMGTLKTVGFSRFFPKSLPEIEPVLTVEDQQAVRQLLTDYYRHHSLVQFHPLFLNDQYCVWRKNGEVVAGVQYHKVHWVVKHMPGLVGTVIVKVVPQVPLLRRIFNPRRFEFLAFEGLYAKPGHERDLLRLMEGLLAREGRYSALIWMDAQCPLHQRLRSIGGLGILSHFTDDSDVYMMGSFRHYSPEAEAEVAAGPFYASAYDYT